MDPIYAEMERLNNNDLINNFKSFSYLRTNNYGELVRFLSYSGPYWATILADTGPPFWSIPGHFIK